MTFLENQDNIEEVSIDANDMDDDDMFNDNFENIYMSVNDLIDKYGWFFFQRLESEQTDE